MTLAHLLFIRPSFSPALGGPVCVEGLGVMYTASGGSFHGPDQGESISCRFDGIGASAWMATCPVSASAPRSRIGPAPFLRSDRLVMYDAHPGKRKERQPDGRWSDEI